MTNLDVWDSARISGSFSWLPTLTLRQRMLALLALAGMPGILVAFFLASSWLQNQTEQIEVSVQRLAKLAAARHDTVIEKARMLSAAVAQRHALGTLHGEGCSTYLAGWLKEFPSLASLSLFDSNGARICASAESELPFQAGEAYWFRKVRDEKKFVLGRYMLGQSGHPLIVAAYPILEAATDNFKGTVSVAIDLRWLNFLSNTIDLPEGATVSALTSEGKLLLHNTAAPAAEGTEAGAAPSARAMAQLAVLSTGTLRAENASGSPRVYGLEKTTSGDMVVAIGQTPYLNYARYWDALVNALGSPLLVLALALIAAAYGSEAFVSRYVRSLTRTVRTFKNGDLSVRSGIPHSKYEIGRLAAAFDSMAAAIERDQKKLETLADERQMLIKELNHRVKNNLQIVLGMLRAGGRGAGDADAQAYLKTLAGRVQTLARIHQLLYERHDGAAPELGGYVEQLTQLLGEFYETEVGPAKIGAGVDDVDLTIGQCISFGLILNELVANAQKHAFKGREAGLISISLDVDTGDDGKSIQLSVTDDGNGMPADHDIGNAGSTGFRLLRALTQSLDGEIRSDRLQPGTAVHVRFPVP